MVPDILEPQEPEILSFTYTGEERKREPSSPELAVPLVTAAPSLWGTPLIGSYNLSGITTVSLHMPNSPSFSSSHPTHHLFEVYVKGGGGQYF